MTLDEFFEKLPKDGWRLTKNSLTIRNLKTDEDCMCPVEVAAGGIIGLKFAREAMGMSSEMSWRIANAADKLPGHDPALRARLLQHCGLKEAS